MQYWIAHSLYKIVFLKYQLFFLELLQFLEKIFYNKSSTYSVGLCLIDTYSNLGYNITVHDLRHTYATHLIANGLDFKTVAELMGHDVSETIKTYSHFTNDMMQRATDVIKKPFKIFAEFIVVFFKAL